MPTKAPIKINAPEYFTRMMEEHKELQDRIIGLRIFIAKNQKFAELDESDRYMLREQYRFMQSYADVLWDRVCKKHNELQEKAIKILER